ncbi:GntR family transcriptional regulator [Amycolatopsis jiangsuensis]|uniref:DNA-binding GntR family transcriptional regulator n=1 Tax=Amycolatopsis jiangsuensis TaxID=1181879 RepID=A0A840J8D6_9PSEU|nr:GntR family transcriptional regulator [Amycolatopsis jiangsuensis]MBB4689744.1 DNA-binding GntR family transcriptional regulator [Amycolatopsis jiangsuensis]
MEVTPLRKAARRGLAEEAADRVREAIFAGHFPPGAPLREVELAASLEISRGSVREGLALLAREGLIHGGWHRPTTVVDVTAVDVEEVYSVRAALDRLAATTARAHATPENLAGLDTRVTELATAVRGRADGPRLLALDIAFHDQVYAAAGNARLTEAWHAVRSQVYLFQLQRISAGNEHYRARVVAEHRELATLIRDGEPARLARAAEDHVHSARRSLLTELRG